MSLPARAESRHNSEAECDAIAATRRLASIPLFANGDVDSPQKAKTMLDYTRGNGLLIGRAAPVMRDLQAT